MNQINYLLLQLNAINRNPGFKPNQIYYNIKGFLCFVYDTWSVCNHQKYILKLIYVNNLFDWLRVQTLL